MEAVKQWFSSLSSKQRTQLGLATIAILAVIFWLMNPQQRSEPLAVEVSEGAAISGTIQVHVVGEVASPGLFELQLGSRVQDAISAAGGFGADAVEHSVNLARVLSDGEQLVILGPQDLDDGGPGGLISLNRASEQQLDQLPGVGPALAKRIVELRQSLGSFSDVRQLREVSGIGEKLFSQIKDQVTL